MKFSDAMRWRYATKKFDPNKQVDETIVDELLDITNLTPTSYGLQPFKMVVLKNQDIQDQPHHIIVWSTPGRRCFSRADYRGPN